MLANLQNVLRQNTAHTELPEHVFVDAIEAALLAAARRVYGANADVSVEINLDASEIRCYVPKTVVNIMRDFSTEIPIDTARRLHAGAELGQTLEVEINPMEFGRIPAQLARQILRQKIKEAERAKIYEEFENREGELVTGHIQRFERGGFILDLEQTEAFLPVREVPQDTITNAANGCSASSYKSAMPTAARLLSSLARIKTLSRGYLSKRCPKSLKDRWKSSQSPATRANARKLLSPQMMKR